MRSVIRSCALAALLLWTACGGDDDGASGAGSGAGVGGLGGTGGDAGTGGSGHDSGEDASTSGTGGSGGDAGTGGTAHDGGDDASSGGTGGSGGDAGTSGTGHDGGDDAGAGHDGGDDASTGESGHDGGDDANTGESGHDGGDDASTGESGTGGTSGTGGSGPNDSLLGVDAASYVEANEQNPTTAPEPTDYVVDTNGIRIHGRFEANSPTQDAYQFNTGSYGTPQGTQPGQPGVWVQVLIDGQRVGFNEGIFLSLDAVENDGYSSLTGGSFNNAGVTQYSEYRLNLTPLNASWPTLAGKDYVIELRATFVGM